MTVHGSLHEVDGAGVVRLTTHVASSPAQVWAALTTPAPLAQWLGDLQGDLTEGGELTARYHATGWEGTLLVEVCRPVERLELGTRSQGEPDCRMVLTLAAEDEGTRLVFEDRGLPLSQLSAYGAGDQVLVEDLLSHLAGRGRCDARARWQELHAGYQQLAPS